MSAPWLTPGFLRHFSLVILTVGWLALSAAGQYQPQPQPQAQPAPQQPSSPTTNAHQLPPTLQSYQQQVYSEFEGFLANNPQQYRARVQQECTKFPQGMIMPYAFPVMAYTNLAIKNIQLQPTAQARIATLIDLALPDLAKIIQAPQGDLRNLSSCPPYVALLGPLNLAIGCYRMVGGDERYNELQRVISSHLIQGLVQSGGKPLPSFPDRTRTLDTIPVLLSLYLYDQQTQARTSQEAVEKHLYWMLNEGSDRTSGLPIAYFDQQSGQAVGAPRCSDIALRLTYLAQLDKHLASELYRRSIATFWNDGYFVSGNVEWPRGMNAPADWDGGPNVFDLSVFGTGYGLGSAIAMHDQGRVNLYSRQFDSIPTLKKMVLTFHFGSQPYLIGDMIPYYPQYVCGFLYGDALLFYVITCQDWFTVAKPAPHPTPSGTKGWPIVR